MIKKLFTYFKQTWRVRRGIRFVNRHESSGQDYKSQEQHLNIQDLQQQQVERYAKFQELKSRMY